MRKALVLAVLAAAAASPAAAQRAVCDRACLEDLLDTYVDAVVAREPARLPLARGVKFTENGQRLDVGEGLWHTATGHGGYALKLADVERGPKIPWTWAIAEVFKIEGGLIGPVESVLHAAPYGTGSGWSTWEESLSSSPRG